MAPTFHKYVSVIFCCLQLGSQQKLDNSLTKLTAEYEGPRKSTTIYDYHTRMSAYKDLVGSGCYIEFIKKGEPSLSQKIREFPVIKLPNELYISEEKLSKRRIWDLAGPRIWEFCRGFPTYLIQEVKNRETADDNPDDNDILKTRVRRRRSTRHYFVGRLRGQTQSQYLNFGNSANSSGKAEAESAYGVSRAIVVGTNGMGQAQSQSSPFDCEDCYRPMKTSQYDTIGKPDYQVTPEQQENIYDNKPETIQRGQPNRPDDTRSPLKVPGRPSTSHKVPSSGKTGIPIGQGPLTTQTEGLGGTYPTKYPGIGNVGLTPGSDQTVGYPAETGSYGKYPSEFPGSERAPHPSISYPIEPEGVHYPSVTEQTYIPHYTPSPGDSRVTGPDKTSSRGDGNAGITGPEYPGEARLPPYTGPWDGRGHTYPRVPDERLYPQPPTTDGRFGGEFGGGYQTNAGGSGRFSGQFSGTFDVNGHRIPQGQSPTNISITSPQHTAGDSTPGVPIQYPVTDTGSRGHVRPTNPQLPSPDTRPIAQYPSKPTPAYGPPGYQIHNGLPQIPGYIPRQPQPINKPDISQYPPQGTGGYVQPNYDIFDGIPQGTGHESSSPPVTVPNVRPIPQYPSQGRGVYDQPNNQRPEGAGYIPSYQKPQAPPGGTGYITNYQKPGLGDVYGNIPSTGRFSGHFGGTYELPGRYYPIVGQGAFPSQTGAQGQYQPGTSPALPGSKPQGYYPSEIKDTRVQFSPGTEPHQMGTNGQYTPGYDQRVNRPGYEPRPYQPGGRVEQYSPNYDQGINRPGYAPRPYQPGGRGEQEVYQTGNRVDQGKYTPGGTIEPSEHQPPLSGGQSETEKSRGQVQIHPESFPGQYPQTSETGNAQYRPTDTTHLNTSIPESQLGIGTQGTYVPGSAIEQPKVIDSNKPFSSEPEQQPHIIDDGGDSQAQTSVQQTNNETLASAQAQGKFQGGTAQSQVSGTYSGSGSFSASAGSDDGNKGALTQVSGSSQGATSSAQGHGGKGNSQAQMQLFSDTGKVISTAQSGGKAYSSQSHVQGNGEGGMANAQSNGVGRTSSQAQIGFSPYNQANDKDDERDNHFQGGGTANAQGGSLFGQSQTQIQGKFKYGIRYSGGAQAHSGTPELSNFSFPRIVPDFQIKPISFATPIPLTNSPTTKPNTKVNSETKSEQDHNSTITKQDEDDNGEDYYEDNDTEQPETNKVITQTKDGQTQHIVLPNMRNLDARVVQTNFDEFHEKVFQPGDTFQPGEIIPGTSGYQIPRGFRGKVKSVASPSETYALGKNSQAQTVTITPGTGKIIYQRTKPNTNSFNYDPYQYYFRSGEPFPNFLSISKSETGYDNPITGRKVSSTHYTHSTTCGLITTTCVFRQTQRICLPNIKRNSDGSVKVC